MKSGAKKSGLFFDNCCPSHSVQALRRKPHPQDGEQRAAPPGRQPGFCHLPRLPGSDTKRSRLQEFGCVQVRTQLSAPNFPLRPFLPDNRRELQALQKACADFVDRVTEDYIWHRGGFRLAVCERGEHETVAHARLLRTRTKDHKMQQRAAGSGRQAAGSGRRAASSGR